MQHKRELGNKYVSGVTVAGNDDIFVKKAPNLAFHIADVPREDFKADPPSHDPPQGQP